MRLSNESSKVRAWLMIAALCVAGVLVFSHAHFVRKYLDVASGLGLRGKAPSTPLTQVYPAFAADAQTWVRHAVALTEDKTLRLRYTTIDNAPDGREVHWNSAWAWAIATSGYIDHWISGVPLPQAIERATLWLPGAVLLVLAAVIGWWTAQRAGALAGAFVVFAFIGHSRIYEGFFPSYADHHGLMTVAVAGMMLGAVFMGGGWWRAATGKGSRDILPNSATEAHSAARFSAICGSFGLWVTAASIIPPLAIVGAAGLVATFVMGSRLRASGATFDPGVWRTWGRTGAVGSLVFYLVEYFPSNMGLRLEANHPLYSLAWLGGGELVAQICERSQRPPKEALRNWQTLLPAFVAVLIVPVTILVGKSAVFVVSDPFLAALHKYYIAEFLPLWKTLQGKGWSSFFYVAGLDNLPLLIGAGYLCIRRREAPFLLWFATIATAGFSVLALLQSRWLLNAAAAQVALALILIAHLAQTARPIVRFGFAAAMAGVLFFYPGVKRITGAATDVRERKVSPKDAAGALARDIATVLRSTQPEGKIVLLTNPNSSTNVGYYGRFQTLGTLYWENIEGLKSAAEVFSAQDLREAAMLVRKHRVTHIAMISDENFIAQYHELLHPGAGPEKIKKSFGYQLLIDRSVPPWLRVVPYKVPDDLAALNVSVLLLQVAFDQSPADALYHLALAKIAMGSTAEAENDLNTLIQRSPQSFQPWLRKGELLFARKDWSAAADILIQGILRAPAEQQPGLFASTAGSFHRERQHAEAIKVYRVALATRFDPTLAGYCAFVLATSADDKLRDGRTALALAERALQQDPNSVPILEAFAAALAELGRFSEAVAQSERALAIAQQRGEVPAQRAAEKRLAAYREQKPWRE